MVQEAEHDCGQGRHSYPELSTLAQYSLSQRSPEQEVARIVEPGTEVVTTVSAS